jgi:hypothetical protein
MNTFDTIKLMLTAAVTLGGTITVPFPAGRGKGDYLLGDSHKLVWPGYIAVCPNDFTVAYTAGIITLTMASTATVPANTQLYLQMNYAGGRNASFDAQLETLSQIAETSPCVITPAPLVLVSLGSPVAASATAIAALQKPGRTTPFTLNGGIAPNAQGVVVPDVVRNVSITSTDDQSAIIIQFSGLDLTGLPQTENIHPGVNTTVYGAKTWLSISGAVPILGNLSTNVSLGFGKTFGLPINLAAPACVQAELVNGVVPGTAGAFTTMQVIAPSPASGDPRGTYTPNGTPNGATAYDILIAAISIGLGAVPYTSTNTGNTGAGGQQNRGNTRRGANTFVPPNTGATDTAVSE